MSVRGCALAGTRQAVTQLPDACGQSCVPSLLFVAYSNLHSFLIFQRIGNRCMVNRNAIKLRGRVHNRRMGSRNSDHFKDRADSRHTVNWNSGNFHSP